MTKRNFLLPILIFFFSLNGLRAGEGMWLPQLLQALNEGDMQTMGMKLTAEQIYSVNQGSLKDAIVHFGGFCTAEVISKEGLILTNHHCGFSAIQTHTTLENNYLRDGFWATNKKDEKMNEDLFAKFIVRIDDVSEMILKGVNKKMTKEERQSVIDKNIQAAQKAAQKESYQDVEIKPFFKGNQYFQFISVSYPDVRLVGAPPSSIGKFGADTDNWEWPRHTGDFSLFRIYSDANGLPAQPSAKNIPLKPKHSLPISLDGVEEGDFSMVFGFPGRTNEYLPASAVEQIMTVTDPARIAIRDRALKIVDGYMRADEAIKIKYASKFASIANGWKKWIGEVQGLTKTNALEKKRNYEAEYLKRLNTQKRKYPKEYYTIISEFDKVYAEMAPYALAANYQSEVTGRNVELLRVAGLMKRLTDAFDNNGATGYNSFKGRLTGYLDGFYKDYSPVVDQDVFAALMEMYVTNLDPKYVSEIVRKATMPYKNDYTAWSAGMYRTTKFIDKSAVDEIFSMEPEAAVEAIQNDPAYKLIVAMQSHYNSVVAPTYDKLQTRVEDLMRTYMQAQMDVFTDKKFFPDANSTMRVTYGKIEGYEPRDAVIYKNKTYLDGMVAKYVPGDYEFDLPKKLLELEKNKDYGIYSETVNGEQKVPVCFLGSNHTTGGNSGSPAIDASGNLIGLNFDRVWEGTMSDINYDRRICRNIMVDARYILFIIDKYAGAGSLIEEMELVHPKKGK